MSSERFQPGFRFSLRDGIVLCGGAIGSMYLWREIWWAGFAVAFVVLNFFLFCNVFRISRRLELIWAASVILLAIPNVAKASSGMPVFIPATLLTIFLIWRETRKPSYHGIFWQRWNPELKTWWEKNGK